MGSEDADAHGPGLCGRTAPGTGSVTSLTNRRQV